MKRAIMMDAKDNVATALTGIKSGDMVTVVSSSQNKVFEIKITEAIPFGHKLAIAAITKGDNVIKYGELIGRASRDIGLGDYVHIDNVDSNRIQMPKTWYRKEQ
jgi:altronate dehydratase small subunit